MRPFILIAALVTLSGCSKNLEQEVSRQKDEIASLKSQITQIASQHIAHEAAMSEALKTALIDTSKTQSEREIRFTENVAAGMTRLESEIQSARKYAELLSDMNKWQKSAQLSSSSKDFSLARNNYGTFPISVVSAEPYLDGHKVVLQIGNMNAASITDASVVVSYATREPAFPLRKTFSSDAEWNTAYDQYQVHWDAWNAKKKKTPSVSIGDLVEGHGMMSKLSSLHQSPMSWDSWK